MRHLGGDVLVGEVRGVASVGGGVRGGVAWAQDPSVGLGEEREIFAGFVADVRVEAVGAGVVRPRAAYTLGHRSVGEAYRARLRIPERGWDGGRWGSAFELLGHRVKDGTPFARVVTRRTGAGDARDARANARRVWRVFGRYAHLLFSHGAGRGCPPPRPHPSAPRSGVLCLLTRSYRTSSPRRTPQRVGAFCSRSVRGRSIDAAARACTEDSAFESTSRVFGIQPSLDRVTSIRRRDPRGSIRV